MNGGTLRALLRLVPVPRLRLAWAVVRFPPRRVITESTVATRAWMFAGKEPPIPAASAWTLAAAVFVALYQGARIAAHLGGCDRCAALDVLQRLDQASDLLPEVGELRHAAESGRAVNRRRYPQAAEDQAHDQRHHDHRDQPPRHRPVPQR